MKQIIDMLDEVLNEVHNDSLLSNEQKEELTDNLCDIQNKIDDMYLEATGELDEEYR